MTRITADARLALANAAEFTNAKERRRRSPGAVLHQLGPAKANTGSREDEEGAVWGRRRSDVKRAQPYAHGGRE